MRKMTQTFAAILLVLIASVTLSACNLGGNLGPSDTSIEVGISMNGYARYQYDVGENFDPNGAKVVVSYDDNTQKEIPLVESMITGFDTTTEGIRSYTITYKTFTLTRNYKVEIAVNTTNGAIYSYHVTAGGDGYTCLKLNLTESKVYLTSVAELSDIDTLNWQDLGENGYTFSFTKSKSFQGDTVLASEWETSEAFDSRNVITSITPESITLTVETAYGTYTHENPEINGTIILQRYQVA